MLDAGAGYRFPGAVGKHWSVWPLVDLREPDAELFGGALPQRDDALFASFAVELHGELAVEEQVSDAQAGEFGHTRAGVVEHGEQDGVALSAPAVSVGRVEYRRDLLA